MTGLAVSHPAGEPCSTELVPGPLRDLSRDRYPPGVDVSTEVLNRVQTREKLIIVERLNRRGTQNGQQSRRLLQDCLEGTVVDGHDYTLTGTTDIPFSLIRSQFFGGKS
jgi:hypothetical protein